MPAPDRIPPAGQPSVAVPVPARGQPTVASQVPAPGQVPGHRIRLWSLWQPRHSFVVVVATTTNAAGGIRAKVSRRAQEMLPPGTLTVGAGLLVLGAGYYAHLAVAGHSLTASGMAAMSVLWSIVFLLGLGVFLPVEQELIRHVAARTTVGQGIAPVVRRACGLSGLLLAAILVPLAAAARPLAGRLFGGDTAMVTVLGCACVALAVTAVSRGTLAGLGAFGGYGAQLAIDGGLRAAMACGLGLAGSHSAVAFGLVLTVAPLLAVLLTLGPLLPRVRAGPPLPWAAISHRLGLLIGTMLLAQVLINAAVISVRLLSPGSPAVVGALLAAAVMARVPLFVFTSLQTSLLPGLAGAIAAGDRARFRRLLAHSCAVVTVLGLAGGLPATILGPWLTQVLFGARPVLGNAAFGWLAIGTLCYMLAMVLGQGAMALARHRDQLLSWVAGVAVLIVITTGPGQAATRVVTAYAAGCATVAMLLAIVLVRRSPATGQHAGPRPGNGGAGGGFRGVAPPGQHWPGAIGAQGHGVRGLAPGGVECSPRPATRRAHGWPTTKQ
jgi:O-antigen/teichoic acid export membrane protein